MNSNYPLTSEWFYYILVSSNHTIIYCESQGVCLLWFMVIRHTLVAQCDGSELRCGFDKQVYHGIPQARFYSIPANHPL